MGNCCGGEEVTISGDKQAGGQPILHQLNYVNPADRQAPARDGSPSVRQRAMAQPSAVAHAPELRAPLHYPGDRDASGTYYQPKGALLLMDPQTGATYPYDDEAFQRYLASERQQQAGDDRPTSAAAGIGSNKTADAQQPTAVSTSVSPPATSVATTTSTTTTADEVKAPSTVDEVTSSAQRQPSVPYEPRDVMISYSRTDDTVMQEIKDQLEAEGITVWVDVASVDAGADFLSKIGEAIIDAKLFVVILSEKAVQSKYCRDEVALAYVSNTAIFPVSLVPREKLVPLMDTGLKLQLANYNWTVLTSPESLKDEVSSLVSALKAELDDVRQIAQGGDLSPPPPDTQPAPPAEDGQEVTSPTDVTVAVEESGQREQSPVTERGMPDFKALRLRERNRVVVATSFDDVNDLRPEQFWTERFGSADYVTWDSFTSAFLETFRHPVDNTFSREDQQLLVDILKRELEVDSDNRIYKYQLMTFCSLEGEAVALWPRVQEQARESFAMKEVFNMDSSVRVEAIENLGKFRSAAVIDALRDLLSDDDANVRAVATVSLSRTDANDPVTIRHILRMLSDKDRLVREAGCLALGHLKARQAIAKLSHLWRNDVISHVREAAAAALRQIGGQEVEDVMRVTKVLAEEIRTLTEMKS